MKEKATFAAGCFWGVEESFRQLPGVLTTQVGYTGGTLSNPTYQQVCSGTTGHAEAVELEFDLSQVTYEQLLSHFFSIHNCTMRNRQGPDIGEQYRSAIFTHSSEQEKLAREKIEELAKEMPIVTQVVEAGPFYRAEEYHQKYVEKKKEGR